MLTFADDHRYNNSILLKTKKRNFTLITGLDFAILLIWFSFTWVILYAIKTGSAQHNGRKHQTNKSCSVLMAIQPTNEASIWNGIPTAREHFEKYDKFSPSSMVRTSRITFGKNKNLVVLLMLRGSQTFAVYQYQLVRTWIHFCSYLHARIKLGNSLQAGNQFWVNQRIYLLYDTCLTNI